MDLFQKKEKTKTAQKKPKNNQKAQIVSADFLFASIIFVFVFFFVNYKINEIQLQHWKALEEWKQKILLYEYSTKFLKKEITQRENIINLYKLNNFSFEQPFQKYKIKIQIKNLEGEIIKEFGENTNNCTSLERFAQLEDSPVIVIFQICT